MLNYLTPWRIVAILLAAAMGWFAWTFRDLPGHWYEAQFGRRPLLAAKSWYYHLSKVDVDVIAKVDADLLVIDYAKGGDKKGADGSESSLVPLTREEVARLKTGPNGKSRLVVSYFSIGEGEQYRFYWKPEYHQNPAPWDMGENCAWPKNHMVRYWSDEWKDIMIRSPESYLRQIVAAGFDGVYLDRIDVYGHMKGEPRDYEAEMKAFVAEIKKVGSALKPGFLVIAQNAEDLLEDRTYRNIIDGLGKEDLLYGSKGTNVRNAQKDIEWSLERLKKLRWDFKPVFSVEYPETKELVASAMAEHRKLGFVPTAAHRSLDGSDPTAPRPPKDAENASPTGVSSSPAPGTPEYISTVCKDKKWW